MGLSQPVLLLVNALAYIYGRMCALPKSVAELNRSQVIDSLTDLASLMADVGPDTCIAETCRSIVRIGRSWP